MELFHTNFINNNELKWFRTQNYTFIYLYICNRSIIYVEVGINKTLGVEMVV